MKPRNINDSSRAPRLDWGLCGRFGHGPGSDRVRLVPRDPRAPSVSGSASRRPSRGRTWRPGRIVPGRTRLRGRQNRAIMRKPTDTPGAAARTILPGRQNRVRAPGPARPRPRHGAPVQQIRTHPTPQAPYTPLRHTQNNLHGSNWHIIGYTAHSYCATREGEVERRRNSRRAHGLIISTIAVR